MEGNTKAIRRTEVILVVLLLLVILIPQITGSRKSEDAKPENLIYGPEDLNDATFACVLGSVYDPLISQLFPGAKLNYVADWADECIQVEQGKADALLWEKSSLSEIHQMYPTLIELPDPLTSMELRWCVHKDALGDALRADVDAFIINLRESGELDRIYDRWADFDAAPDRVESYPRTVPVKGTIRTVSALDWQPVCYMNNGNPCGFMIDLLYRFAAEYGYELEEEYVSVPAMLAGFNTGKYDIIIYGMEIMPESLELVNYTEPMMTDETYIIIQRARSAAAQADGTAVALDSREKSFLEQLYASFDKNFLRENRWQLMLQGLGLTMLMSLLSITLGTVLGGGICALRMSRKTLPQALGRVFIRGMQGMPIVLMLLICYYVIFGKANVDPLWVCVLCFSLDFAAYASEMFRSAILAVPDGQRRASMALGFTRAETFRHVIFPQMVIHCLPPFMGQVIATVKLTSVAGYISVMDLTRVSDLIRSRTYEAFFPLVVTALIYFLLASLLTWVLKVLSGRLDPACKKREIRGVKLHADQG